MRFLLSIAVLTAMMTFLSLPLVRYAQKFIKEEASRIDRIFNKKDK